MTRWKITTRKNCRARGNTVNNDEQRVLFERRADGFYLSFIQGGRMATIGPLDRWNAFKLGFMLMFGSLFG